jgi:hypothetical protein
MWIFAAAVNGQHKKKPSDSAKTENEGILKFLPKTVQELASSFSWTEKLVPHPRDRTSTAKPVS